MEREKSPNGLFKRMLRLLVKEGRGQVVALFALGLPVLIGSGALAVDVGYMMVARNTLQNASDGGARAGADAHRRRAASRRSRAGRRRRDRGRRRRGSRCR